MNQELLEELSALLALGELSEEDEEVLMDYISEEERTDILDAVHSLAYDSTMIPLPAKMKSKILASIAEEEAPFLPKRFGELSWEPHPLIAGVHLANLYRDTQRREVSYLVRCNPNVRFPVHLHQGVEEILILDGEVSIGEQTYQKGDFLLSRPNSTHAPETPNGCLFYVHTSQDDRFVQWNPDMVWQLFTWPFRRSRSD